MAPRRFTWMLRLGLLAAMTASCSATPASDTPLVQDLPTMSPTARATAAPPDPARPSPTAPTPAPTAESIALPATSLDGVAVLGYLAYIRPAPEGSGFDDAVQFLPDTVIPPYGVMGASSEIEARLKEARTGANPGEMLNLYGEFACGVDDVYGCQLVVSYITLPMEQTNPEPVTGLTGRIVSLGDGAQFDDKLVLDGPLPVEIGITSAVFENGHPMLRDAIAALRDTGQTVTVDGQIIAGAADVNGCQVQVRTIYIDGEPVDPLGEWLTYTEDEWGLSLRYPPNATARRGDGPFVTVAWDDVELVLGCRLPDQTHSLAYRQTESLAPMGYVRFLGDDEPRLGWWVDGRLLGVRYGKPVSVRDGGEIRRGPLTCTLSLWQRGSNWFATGDLAPEAQETADIMLSTVAWVEASAPQPAGLPNPAAAFCVEQGGQQVLRTDAQGGQYGICLFGDGSECEEWAFFRGECAPVATVDNAAAEREPTYANTALGFALSASADWPVRESGEFVVLTREIGEATYVLFIGVRAEGASEPVFRTGMPAGEFQSGGMLPVLNQTIERRLLTLDSKVKVVAYDLARAGGREFIIYLDQVGAMGQPYEGLDIAADVQAEADAIVSSLRLYP